MLNFIKNKANEKSQQSTKYFLLLSCSKSTKNTKDQFQPIMLAQNLKTKSHCCI